MSHSLASLNWVSSLSFAASKFCPLNQAHLSGAKRCKYFSVVVWRDEVRAGWYNPITQHCSSCTKWHFESSFWYLDEQAGCGLYTHTYPKGCRCVRSLPRITYEYIFPSLILPILVPLVPKRFLLTLPICWQILVFSTASFPQNIFKKWRMKMKS